MKSFFTMAKPTREVARLLLLLAKDAGNDNERGTPITILLH